MCAVEVIAATSVAAALSAPLSVMGRSLGLSGAVALLLRSETLKIDRLRQDFPPASHVAICDTKSAVAVTARRTT